MSDDHPLPSSVTLNIGGENYEVPKGATVQQVHNDAPPVDPITNLPFKTAVPGEHLSYWTIERGATRVRVDGETGEVFEADIALEDEEEFADFID